MSWDYTEMKYPCPCGQGTYTEISGSNDWQSTSRDWRMDCPACQKVYALHTYTYYRHGMAETGYRWVRRTDLEAARELNNKARDLRSRAVLLLQNRYLRMIVSRFDGSSKKAIWTELQDNFPSFMRLSTFYARTKGKTKSEYLAELFDDYALCCHALKLLGIEDSDISSLLTDADTCDTKAKDVLSK